jgi:CBS domain-containing protein
MLSDYYWDCAGFASEESEASFDRLAESLGRRIDHLTVGDVMMTEVITIDAQQTVQEAAELLLDRHVHRVLVTNKGELAGLISSLDLVRYLMEQQR